MKAAGSDLLTQAFKMRIFSFLDQKNRQRLGGGSKKPVAVVLALVPKLLAVLQVACVDGLVEKFLHLAKTRTAQERDNGGGESAKRGKN